VRWASLQYVKMVGDKEVTRDIHGTRDASHLVKNRVGAWRSVASISHAGDFATFLSPMARGGCAQAAIAGSNFAKTADAFEVLNPGILDVQSALNLVFRPDTAKVKPPLRSTNQDVSVISPWAHEAPKASSASIMLYTALGLMQVHGAQLGSIGISVGVKDLTLAVFF
jgi:hypothetical protein